MPPPVAPQKQLLEKDAQEYLLRFESNWDEDRLADFARRLPQDVRRTALLRELVKIDLRLQWAKGNRYTLDAYLLRYPELGTPETVEFDLICAESQARRQAGENPYADLSKRFPRQMGQFQQLQQGVMKVLGKRAGPADADSTGPEHTETLTPASVPVIPVRAAAAPPGTPPSLPQQKISSPEPSADPGAYGSETLRPVESAADVSLPGDSAKSAPTKNRYEIHKELGRGNMGTVYLAYDTLLHRQVAMKIPHFQAGDSPEMGERFMREARSAAKLSHPNICPIFDVGERDGKPFLTMAYIEGQPLDKVLREARPKGIPPRRAVEIVYKLARALDEAHREGVVHRDLKPANVMMNRRSEPVIMDFGLARRMDDARMTHQGSFFGTPAYMSPEQARGELTVGPPSDQYSLGVMLYEMLTGEVPFKGTIALVMAKVLTEDPRRPRAIRPDIDPVLEQTCLKAMARNIADRFASMGDFATALEPFLRAPRTDAGIELPLSQPVIDLGEVRQPASKPSIDIGKPSGEDELLETHIPPGILTDRRPAPAVGEGPEGTMPPSRAPGWKQPGTQDHKPLETIPQRASRKRSRMVGIVTALLLVGLAAVLGFFFFRQESPAQFKERIREFFGKREFSQALDEIDNAKSQDEKTRTDARDSVRDAVIVWVGPELKQVKKKLQAKEQPLPATKQDVKKVCALLKRLLEQYRDNDQLTGPYNEAQSLELQIQVQELVAQHDYEAALLAIDRAKNKPFADPKWAAEQRSKILSQWRDKVRSELGSKLFRRAALTAKAILDFDQADGEAKTLRDEALKTISEITAAVEEFAKNGLFAKAREELDKRWPSDEGALGDKIKERWYQAAKAQRDQKEWDKAKQTLAELLKAYPDEANPVKDRMRDVWRGQIQSALDGGNFSDLKGAEKLLKSPEVVSLLAPGEVKLYLERIQNLGGVPGRIRDALAHLKGLTGEGFARARKELDALTAQADPLNRKRVQALLVVLKPAADAAAASDPLMLKELPVFENELTRFKENRDVAEADKDALVRVCDELLTRRIKASVRAYPDMKKWADGLADCRKVKAPTLWTKAWELECKAELAGSGEIPEALKAELQEGVQALQKFPDQADEAAAYRSYVCGVVDALTADRRKATSALLSAYAGDKAFPLLQSKHRKSRAATLLVEAAELVRQDAGQAKEQNLDQPFGTPGEADAVYKWLTLARALDPENSDPHLPLDLALAAWSKTSKAKDVLASEVARLVNPDALASLSTQEAYLVLVLHADTRDETLDERIKAITSYEQAIAKAQELVQKPPSGAKYTEHVFDKVIAPVMAAKGKQLLGEHAENDSLKQKLGHLCARISQMIRADQFAWSKVKALGDNPLRMVAQLYKQAYHLAQKVEYLVQHAFIRSEVGQPDLAQLEKDANEAITKEHDYWGAHSLKGFTELLRSRKTSDQEKRVKALRDADNHFADAARFVKPESSQENRENLSIFYRYWSSACLELGNYLFGDPAEKAKYIRNAETCALEATKLNPGYLDAWDALAFAREDVAWVLKETDKYAQAKDAFTKAIRINFRSDRVRPWLGRGRTMFRWASVPPNQQKMAEAERELKLTEAESDLGVVIKQAAKSPEAAEAYFWQANIHLFRRDKAKSLKKKDELLAHAEKCFGECLVLSRQTNQSEIVEAALAAWSHLALTQAIKGRTDKAGQYFRLTEKLATDLAEYNVPRAALIRGKVAIYHKKDTQEALRIFGEGLMKQHRKQDKEWLVKLYCQRAIIVLANDMDAAISDANAAVQEAEQAKLDKQEQAYPRGTLGIALYWKALPDAGPGGDELRAKALSLFRQAVQGAPKHGDGWMWRWWLVEILSRKGLQGLNAQEKREAQENIAIAARQAAGNPEVASNQLSRINSLNEAYNPKP